MLSQTSTASTPENNFAALFEESLTRQEMRIGEVITAEVVSVDPNVVIVNAGLKSESAISTEEFKNDRGELEVKPGDFVSVAIEALELFREVDNPTGIALAFLDLAFLATWEGRHQDAIRLAGASESIRERTGGGPPPGFGGMLEGDPVAEARAHLSEDPARRAWEEGRAMSVEQAAAVAGEETTA